MSAPRVCHEHGDTMKACRDQHDRSMYCDGQGSPPTHRWDGQKFGGCQRCGKFIALRADGTIRAHNGRAK